MFKSLLLLNVKNLSGEFTLEPLTIISGDNGVGKTAFLDGIELALHGHIEELGKTPSSFWVAGEEETLRAVLKSESKSFGTCFSKVTKAGKVSFHQDFGHLELVDEHLINARWFAGMSTSERRKAILELIQPKLTRPITTEICDILMVGDEILERSLLYLTEYDQTINARGIGLFDSLSILIDLCDKDLKTVNRELKEGVAELRGISSASIQSGATMELELKRETLNKGISELDRKIYDAESRLRARQARKETLKPAKFNMQLAIESYQKEVLEKVYKTIRQWAPPIDRVEELVQSIQGQISPPPKVEVVIEEEPEVIETESLSDLKTSLTAKRLTLQGVNDELKERWKAQGAAERRVKLDALVNDLKIRQGALTAIKEAAGPKGLLGRVLKESVDQFKDNVNGVLRTISHGLDFDLYFDDEYGKDACRFIVNGCDWEFASNSEQTLAAIAIAIAYANRDAIRVLLLDNCEHFEHARFIELINGLKVLLGFGTIHNAVLAGLIDYHLIPGEFVHDLGYEGVANEDFLAGYRTATSH